MPSHVYKQPYSRLTSARLHVYKQPARRLRLKPQPYRLQQAVLAQEQCAIADAC